MQDVKPIVCPHCSHGWHTKSDKKRVTCPHCFKKINTEKNKIN